MLTLDLYFPETLDFDMVFNDEEENTLTFIEEESFDIHLEEE